MDAAAAQDTQLFRDVFNASPVGIAVENLDGQPLFVNPAFCSFVGFSEDELRNKHCVDFSPPEDTEKDWALFQKLRAGLIDHYQLEKRYFRRDGSLVWGRLSISLLSGRPSPLVIAMVEDITEKKRAEDVRWRHAAIVESSEDAIASVTLDGVIATWNAGAQRLFGYTEMEAVGKPVTIVVPPELLDEENKIIATLKTSGRIEQFETVRLSKTGKRINVSLTISPIKDSAGKTCGFSGISRDITERKRAEDKLREYERAVEGAEEMIVVVDRQYRYLIANRQFLKMRKMGREQVVGRFAHEVLDKDFFKTVAKPKLDECFQGTVVTYETKYSYPEIGERDLVVSYFPIEGASGVDRVACIMHDITDRKRSEESLRESEQRLKLATEVGRMYAYDWDVKADIVVRSSQHVKVLGLTAPLNFSHHQFVDKIHPDDRPKFLAAIAGLTPDNPTSEVTYRALASDPTLVWLKSNGRGFFDAEGHLQRVVGMVSDVTNLKRAEETLAGMTRKLIESQEQERGRIARELHDDISQRLALLAVELEQLQDSPSEVGSRLKELQEKISEISHGIQALSHDLHSSQLDYLGAVAGMRSWCNQFGKRRNIEIDFKSNVLDTLPFEMGLCLFRVLQEALHNAVKHSGVKRVEVQIAKRSNEVHLTVSDSGKGFEIEAARQGRGLGLTSMQERVRLVNGTIAIDSKPMRGTTVHVRVPFESEPRSELAG